MIRVVLDTNIVVSALLQPLGPPARVLMLTLNGSIELCISVSVYEEYEEVVNRPRFQRSDGLVAVMLQAIREHGLWVHPTELVTACSDPDDNIFLECAEAAGADNLVTGNLKHFPVLWPPTRIITPRRLPNELSMQKPGSY